MLPNRVQGKEHLLGTCFNLQEPVLNKRFEHQSNIQTSNYLNCQEGLPKQVPESEQTNKQTNKQYIVNFTFDLQSTCVDLRLVVKR